MTTPANIIIRTATGGDAGAISALIRRNADAMLAEEYSAAQLAAWKRYNTPARLRERLKSRTTFGAYRCGRLSGTMALDGAELVGFYVSPSRRGQGIGKLLLARLEAYAISQGIQSQSLTSSPSATTSYLQHGWKTRRSVALSILGVDSEETLMTRTLAPNPSLQGRSPMHLVMFDIDGTLTEARKVDGECFVRSFMNVFGFADIDTVWPQYPHTTDSGIFDDVFTSRMGRSPTAQDVSRFSQHFIQLLAAASSQSPFAPVAGVDKLLSRLAQGGSHPVSLATGGWRDSARLKMASAGMCFDDHPAASADDALDRESIMRLSRQRAAERYGGSLACTVYVGDGVWDARPSRNIGIPFIGIGTGSRATRLTAEGAVWVFPDFCDGDLF